MASKEELQKLLRFLSQDAKLPLMTAMSKVQSLQKAALTTPESIANTNLDTLNAIFTEPKDAKQVLTAAKRLSKKRSLADSAPSNSSTSPSSKRNRVSTTSSSDPLNAPNPDSTAFERTLLLPTSSASLDTLKSTVLYTNRAPLVLAFAVVLLAYTHPHQPLSSRLSLAQAVVSANSRSKAVSIGLESGPSAEEEGFAEGQPKVKILGRQVPVLRRWSYEFDDNALNEGPNETGDGTESKASTQTLVEGESYVSEEASQADEARKAQRPPLTEATVPLWGLDTEALRRSNRSKPAPDATSSQLPIYTAQSARSYLLRSFASASASTTTTPGTTPQSPAKPSAKKLTPKAEAAQKEVNLALLLQALDLLVASWAPTLGRDELDRRAWAWYVAVRPDVEGGQKGWGERGRVELGKILGLRRGA